MSNSISTLIYQYANRNPSEYQSVQQICALMHAQGHKSAIQQCNKDLKRSPSNYIVLALKAVALSASAPQPLSTASRTEILAIPEFIMNDANGAGLGSADVLRFLMWALTKIGKKEEILNLLAKATQRHSENEDVSTEAFLYFITAGEKKSAQQVGMKLHRNFATEERYLWWSVMSIILQVREGGNSMNGLLLSLAERQIIAHYAALRVKNGIFDLPANSITPTAVNGNGNGGASGSSERTIVKKVLVRDKGKGKGKAKVEEEDTDDDTSSLDHSVTSTPAQPTLSYDSAHVFHLVARFLELRVINSVIPSSATTPPSRLILPSVSATAAAGTPREVLLSHFASAEGEKWCTAALGLEIQRREFELKYGTLSGGEWVKSWERMHRSIQDGDTNWHTMLHLIQVNFAIASGSEDYSDSRSSIPSEDGMFLLRRSQTLFRTLADENEKGRKERGFIMGLLEIAKECRKRGWEESSPLAGLCTEYFDRFSTKTCCFDDLKPYLSTLTVDECIPLLARFRAVSEASWVLSSPDTQRLVNSLKAARFIAPEAQSVEAEEFAAEAYLRRYFEALPMGQDLPATELQPADDFALLAAQAYVSLYRQTRNREYLEKGLTVLEFASRRSQHKYQIRLLMINIYRLLGSSLLALQHYETLRVKQIQHDTLSHIVLLRGSTFSVATGISSLKDIADPTISWYCTGIAEATEMPVKAFNLERYNKIEEFTIFQERLRSSLSAAILTVESLRMKVLSSANISEKEVKIHIKIFNDLITRDTSTFSDNRDFNTLPNLQSKVDDTIWTQTQMGPRPGTAWLRAMCIMYLRFLEPATPVSDEIEFSTSEFTPSENALFILALSIQKLISSGVADGNEEDDILTFFREQEVSFQRAIESTTALPWEALHIAAAALEGYSILDLSIDTHLSNRKLADYSNLVKRLKTLRTAVRDVVRNLGTKVSLYAKHVGKQRSKTVAGLTSLLVFPLLDEHEVSSFASTLVESRKMMADGLAAGIIKRCAK